MSHELVAVWSSLFWTGNKERAYVRPAVRGALQWVGRVIRVRTLHAIRLSRYFAAIRTLLKIWFGSIRIQHARLVSTYIPTPACYDMCSLLKLSSAHRWTHPSLKSHLAYDWLIARPPVYFPCSILS